MQVDTLSRGAASAMSVQSGPSRVFACYMTLECPDNAYNVKHDANSVHASATCTPDDIWHAQNTGLCNHHGHALQERPYLISLSTMSLLQGGHLALQ